MNSNSTLSLSPPPIVRSWPASKLVGLTFQSSDLNTRQRLQVMTECSKFCMLMCYFFVCQSFYKRFIWANIYVHTWHLHARAGWHWWTMWPTSFSIFSTFLFICLFIDKKFACFFHNMQNHLDHENYWVSHVSQSSNHRRKFQART